MSESQSEIGLPADFRSKYGPWALVIGGSDGIGAACAHHVARAGLNVALLARREDPLTETANAIESQHGVETSILLQDLTAPDLIQRLADTTAEIDIGLLLCITGSSVEMTRFLDGRIEDALSLVQRNVAATVALAHHFGQRMRERGRGGMMFCTSIAGLAGCSYQSVYSASKAFNQMFAESLWHDLHPHGIDALCLAIGATSTPSTAKLGLGFDETNSMRPEDVAYEGLSHLGKAPFWAAGEQNRAVLPFFQGTDRAAAIEALSAATASMNDLKHVSRVVVAEPTGG